MRGFVPPGYKYLGPGNSLDLGEPTNANDAVARLHDLAYDAYLKTGKNPYVYFSNADRDFLHNLQPDGIATWFAQKVFQIKEKISPSLSELTPSTQMPTGNLRNKRKFHELEIDASGQNVENIWKKPSLGNLRGTTNMDTEEAPMAKAGGVATMAVAASGASTGFGKGSETKITPLPKHVTMGMPDYFTTKHTWYNNGFITLTTTSLDSAANDIIIRINSIYDIFRTSDGASIQQPKWRDHFAAMYDYYAVISMEWRCVLQNHAAGTAPAGTEYDILYRTYGDVQPTFVADTQFLRNDPNIKVAHLGYDVNHKKMTTIGGYLTHADYAGNLHEINQDGQDVIWTAKGTDPLLKHDLHIMPRRKFNATANDRIWHEIELIYTVQWKQQNATYKFNTLD